MRKKIKAAPAASSPVNEKNPDPFEVVLCYIDGGYRVMLKQNHGRKWIHGVILDCPVRMVKLPLMDEKYMTRLEYTAQSTAKRFLESAKHLNGATAAAKRLLHAAKKNQKS